MDGACELTVDFVEPEANGDQGLEDPMELRDALRGGRGGTGGAVGDVVKRVLPIDGRLVEERDRIVPLLELDSWLGAIFVEAFHRTLGLVGVSTEERDGEPAEADGEIRL